MEKQVGSMQSESYTWAPQVVSNQDFKRPGAWQATIYDSNVYAALLVSKTIVRDGASHSTTYSDPDLYGNPRSITESGPNGGFRTTNLTYFQGAVQWILRQVQNETVLGGTQITRDFDIKGNLRSVVKDNVTTGYSYDANGNVSQATFPRGLIQSYSAYKLGIPQLEIQPEAISISRTVSDSGNVLSEKNARGYTTYYEHDGLNRLTKITSPRGNPTRIKYEKASTTAIRCPLNVIQCDLTESTLYDGFGRVKKVTLGGIERSYSPDFLGRIVFVSDPGASSGTYYSYDIIDRVTNVLNADSKSRTIKFDPGKKKVTDERGHSIIYDYRAYGDPSGQFLMAVSSSAEPSVNLIIGRDGRDSVISVKQGGFTRTYDYDGRGYLKSVVNPETGTTLYERDDANNIKSRKTGNSGMTFFDYDFRNRLKNVIYPGSTPSVSNTYTKTDRLETVISSVASRSFGYDENDNLRSESLTVDGQNFVLGYGYNENDQLSSLIYPRSGRVLDYSPDALGRPAQVSGFVNSVTYWPSGQLKQVNYANGTASNYGQNSRLWPSSFQTGRGAIGYLNSSYTYDGVGNLNTISDSVDAGYNRTLDYDGVNRLRIANGPWGSGSLSYDGTGNLRSQSFGSRSLTYNYNSINQLASISGAQVATFSYDVFGNVIGNGVKTFNYDDAPNMSCADCGSAAGAQYQYDGLNQRVSTLKAGVKTLEFYSSNGNLLSELTPSLSNRLAEYIYLGGKRVATIGPSPVSISLPTQIPIAAAGQAFTVTATLAGGVSPSGTVRFFDGPSLLGTIGVFSGKATVSTTFLTLGAHSLTATYSGDAVNFGSSTSATVTVLNSTGIAPAEGAVFSALAGKLTVLSATVTGNSPTGTMSFYDGNVLLGTASLVAGKGSLNTTITTVGLHTITFVYSGDANNPGSSTSATLNVTLPVESLMPILQILLLDD